MTKSLDKNQFTIKQNLVSFFFSILVITAIVLSISLPSIDYDNKRIIEIFLISTIFFVSIFLPTQYKEKKKKLTVFYLSFLFLGISSSLIAISPKYALIELITFIGLYHAIRQFSLAWKIKNFAIIISYSLIISMIIIEVIFFTIYLAYIISGNNFSIHEFFPAFANVRFFNQFQIWTLPFIGILLLQKNISLHKFNYFFGAISVSWWLIFFSTGSRGASLAVLTATLISCYFFRGQIKDYLLITLKLSIFGFSSYQILFNLLPFLLNNDLVNLLKSLEIRSTTADRVFLWEKACHYIFNNPFLGIGPMHYALTDNPDLSSIDSITHPHNSILQWGAEWGLPSLILILLLITYTFKKWFKKFNSLSLGRFDDTHSQLIIATTISVHSALIYSLFSGVFIMPASQLTAIIPISLSLFLYQQNNTHSQIRTTFLYKAFLGSIATLYLYLLLPDIIKIFFETNDVIKIVPIHPRFWLNGSLTDLINN